MGRLAPKILITILVSLLFLVFTTNEVSAAVSWGQEPYLNNDKNRILFHIKKATGDEFIVVLYVDGKAVDNLHCGKGTSNCQTSDNKGGALSIPSTFTDPTATVKVCSGGGGQHNANKWNCESGSRTLLLETTVDLTGAPGGPGSAPGPGQNPCVGGICNTALGNISTNPTAFVGRILRIATGLAGGLALILMVIGSIRVLISSGDQQRLAAGRDMIVAAVAGLLFLIFSVLILQFIGVQILDIPFT